MLTEQEWMDIANQNIATKQMLCSDISCSRCPVGMRNCSSHISMKGRPNPSQAFYDKHNWTKKLELL